VTSKRGQKATIEVNASHLSEVRSKLATANLMIRKEETTKRGSTVLYFSQLSEAEFLRLLSTVPLEAYAKSAVGFDPNSPLVPEVVRQHLRQSLQSKD
jgi:hypothetical protein